MSKTARTVTKKNVSNKKSQSGSKTMKKVAVSNKKAKLTQKRHIPEKHKKKYDDEDTDDYNDQTFEENDIEFIPDDDEKEEVRNELSDFDDRVQNRFNILLSDVSHQTVSEMVITLNTDTLITTSYKESGILIFLFDKKDTIYKKIGREILRKNLFINIRQYVAMAKKTYLHKISTAKDESERKKITDKLKIIRSLSTKIGTVSFMNAVTDILIASDMFYKDNMLEIFDSRDDVVNFKNGLVEIRTGKFRERTSDDFFTKTLDYDYVQKQDKNIINHLEEIIKRICNDDDETTENIKSWFGYCMTGETIEQRSMWLVGHSAANGKSTILEAFDAMFHIYCTKLSSNAYSENNQKKYKQFTGLKNKRCAWMEEIDRKKLDIKELKDHINGGVIGSNEILFGTVEKIPIYFKLNFVSNNYPNFANDNGMARRGYVLEHTNRFVDQKTYDEAKNKKGLYIRDNTIKQLIFKDDYKIALFHILLPYATKYYKKQFKENNMEQFNDNWISICSNNDKITLFISEKYERTDNENDKIHKDDFLQEYQQYYNLKKITFSNILNDIKRIGLDYNRQARVDGKKGAITGIKELPE